MPEKFYNHGPERELADFEVQFSNQEKMDVLGGTIETVDINPKHAKTDIPTVVAPGWGETTEVFKRTIQTLVECERRVLSLNHARAGVAVEPREDYPLDELRKAMALLQLLEKKGIAKADVVAHSEGAINTVIAASLQPEKFNNIVLVAPGGLIGKDSFPKLFKRFSLHAIQGAFRALAEADNRGPLVRTAVDRAKYIGKNPLRSLREAVAISASDIHETIKELHSQGIGMAVVHGVDDPVFPMEQMQQIAKQDQLDGFVSVKGDHNEILLQPEYARLADKLLTDLENKKNKPRHV